MKKKEIIPIWLQKYINLIFVGIGALILCLLSLLFFIVFLLGPATLSSLFDNNLFLLLYIFVTLPIFVKIALE